MKRLILGLALVAAVAACKSQTHSSVASDECAGTKADCCPSGEKADCSSAAEKADCGKTCPVTGKKIN